MSAAVIYWMPRSLAIAIILFVSMFALDAFSENRGFWSAAGAFAIHLIPTLILVVSLVLAWRWEWAGALLWAAFGVAFAFIVRADWWGKALFAVPCLLTAALFFVSWRHRAG